MIINIPITIDEQALQNIATAEIQNKIVNELTKRITETFISYGGAWGNRHIKEQEGIVTFIQKQINSYLDEHKDDIIEATSKELAMRLMRTKKGKAILEDLTNEN